ncbi:MAG: methylated-DNA--[protein]-cysteine S-methyltransferase [Opitutales bacterium]|nr:methylated-DNA--[protein]-cysteine S-methyltransferase [Opitutales bacterium]
MIFPVSQADLDYLCSRDKKLAAVIGRYGLIGRECERDLFEAVVHNIVAQQISNAAQAAVWARLRERAGKIDAGTLARLVPADFAACGISERKAGYILDFAQKIRAGTFDLEALKTMDDASAIAALSSLKGIGVWTAEMLLLFCLRRRDILSFGDWGILQGLKKIYGREKITREFFERCRRRFSPLGSVASFYIWAAAAPQIHYCHFESPAGTMTLAEQGGAIIRLSFGETAVPTGILEDGNAVLKNACEWLRLYFAGTGKLPPQPKIKLSGTPFELAVWREARRIKYGRSRSYGDLAKSLADGGGNGKNPARAVARALGKNPVLIFVPCHRVIGGNGSLCGYSGGLDKKRALLRLEKIAFRDAVSLG